MDTIIFSAIKHKDGYWLSIPYTTNYEKYIFSPSTHEKTWEKHWISVKELPNSVRQLYTGATIGMEYTILPAVSAQLSNLPKSLKIDFYYDNSGIEINDPYLRVKAMYGLTVDDILKFYSGTYIYGNIEIEVPFKIELICDVSDKDIPTPKIMFSSNLTDMITTPKVLLTLCEVTLDKKEVYKEVLRFIKENHNKAVVSLELTYDESSITGYKIINPYKGYFEYFKDLKEGTVVKGNLLNTRYFADHTKVRLFYLTPEGLPKFSGKTYKEAQDNLNAYLDKLYLDINRPLCKCEHCNGNGYIDYKD